MTFPVLHAHQIFPHFFQLSGSLTPVSIRDQMVRGQMLITQAQEAGLLAGPKSQIMESRPLLVVGAGAAGATVALCAARLGVPTWLVDRGESPFALQAACSTRWIDPCQYDWPFDHWHTAEHPSQLRGESPPLPWKAALANQLSATWKNELAKRACDGPAPLPGLRKDDPRYPLHLLYGVTARRPDPSNDSLQGCWTIRFDIDEAQQLALPVQLPERFGMVVWTAGFGQEIHVIRHGRTQLPTFSGFPFWDEDSYEEPDYGLLPGVTPRVVISGAGDGGLQDFLRIMTRHRAAGDIVRELQLPADVILQLKSAENRAQRAYHWGGHGEYDHVVLSTLHDEHQRLARHLAGQPALRDRLRLVLRENTPQTIHLVYSCNHFPHVYALNRFLVLLIAAYLERDDLLISGKRTLNVVTAGAHRCRVSQDDKGYALCHGQDHVVHLADAPTCTAPREQVALPTQSLSANMIIIRHGVSRQDWPQPHLPDISMPRQLPPYHIHG